MNLATARGIGGSIAGILLSACAMPIILAFSSATRENAETGIIEKVADGNGYFIGTVILSIVMIPLFWLCALGCKEKYTEHLHGDVKKEKAGFFKGLKSLVQNDQLIMVVVSTLCGTICVSGRMGLLVYYVIYVVGSYEAIASIFTVMTVAQLIGTLIIPFGTKFMGKRNYLILIQGIMVVGFMALFINPHCNTAYLMVVSFICGICNSASAICPGMISDCIEYGDWKLGMRQEGITASLLSFGVKVSTAISGSAGVLLLEAAGYVANAQQTPEAQSGINMVVNLVPAIIGAISLIPLLFYKLNAKKVAEIREDLENGRRKSDGTATAKL